VSEPRFFHVQRAFTEHLRDPDNAPPPDGLARERVAVYSNAVIRNAETFISDNFPRVKAVMPEEAWSAMVRDYFLRHRSTTPLFVELPGEFLNYLDELREEPDDPPFLYELAHFEMLETEVSADESRIDDSDVDPLGDVMRGIPVVNPTLRLVRYAFPVHSIDETSRFADSPDSPTFILAFRDREHRYGTIDVNVASARAVELLLAGDELSGEAVMRALAGEFNLADVDAVVAGGREILGRFVERDVILGIRDGSER